MRVRECITAVEKLIRFSFLKKIIEHGVLLIHHEAASTELLA